MSSQEEDLRRKMNGILDSRKGSMDAINDKGVPTDDVFSTYPENIRKISTMYRCEHDWMYDPLWWDVKKILEEDTEPYEYKYIILSKDRPDDSLISRSDMAKTSDGSVYYNTSTAIYHRWNNNYDKRSNCDFNTRYTIYYNNNYPKTAFSNANREFNYAILIVFNFDIIVADDNSTTHGNDYINLPSTIAFNFRFLDFINGKCIRNYTKNTTDNTKGLFRNCTRLENINGKIICEDNSSLFYAFSNCYNMYNSPNIEVRNKKQDYSNSRIYISGLFFNTPIEKINFIYDMKNSFRNYESDSGSSPQQGHIELGSNNRVASFKAVAQLRLDVGGTDLRYSYGETWRFIFNRDDLTFFIDNLQVGHGGYVIMLGLNNIVIQMLSQEDIEKLESKNVTVYHNPY